MANLAANARISLTLLKPFCYQGVRTPIPPLSATLLQAADRALQLGVLLRRNTTTIGQFYRYIFFYRRAEVRLSYSR